MPKITPGIFTKQFLYVKTIISLTLFAILLLHLLSSIPNLLSAIKDYQQAERVYFLNDVSDDLYTAVGNYGFERGRVNVVLNDVRPLEKMEEYRQFILDRRAEGDTALSNALAKLKEVRQTEIIRNAIEKINQFAPEVARLRKETASELELPKANRKQALAETWFSAMTDNIHRIESLLVGISNEISDADGIISRYSSLKRCQTRERFSCGCHWAMRYNTVRQLTLNTRLTLSTLSTSGNPAVSSHSLRKTPSGIRK